MLIIVGCEESQAVTNELRKRGHEAYSCDIQECSGDHPEWHIKADVRLVIETGGLLFNTQDGKFHTTGGKWHGIILHPPCTKVAVSGNGTYANTQERIEAANWNADLFFLACRFSDKVAMEQPVTVLRTVRPDLPKPQYVDLWWFGTRECKKTALFLKGFPKLKADNNVGPPPKGEARREWMKTWMMTPSEDRGKLRSKLDHNFARAIAEQWTPNLNA